jgi:hypothetical protein
VDLPGGRRVGARAGDGRLVHGRVGAVAYPHPVSKVDAQRALRAARLARTAAAPAARPAAPAAPPATTQTPPGTGGACGHRNMAGKECVRPAGHSEKSHRYS